MNHRFDGAAVLDDLTAFLRWYSVYPDEHCAPTYALWLAHTHATMSFYVSPRIIFSSPEPGSGKTRDLELGALFAHAPRLTISTTTAALYRRIGQALDEGQLPPTILFDEVDAIFGRTSTPQVEDLRALLNSGYKRGATVDRCEGDAKNMKVREFPVFAPVALAGLAGKMPRTITSRAITIHKRRRAPGEVVHPFRERDAANEATEIREDLVDWVGDVAVKLAELRPVMPPGVVDRPAEVWEALLAIADQAGGHWPVTAREACRHFVLKTESDQSLGVQLLADCRAVFNGRDRVTTEELIASLRRMDEAPWSDMHGKLIDGRTLARLLKPYGIKSRDIKHSDGKVTKGYFASGATGFADAWQRYVPPSKEPEKPNQPEGDPYLSATNATNATGQVRDIFPVAPSDPVAETSATQHPAATEKKPLTSKVAAVAAVADKTGSSEVGRGKSIEMFVNSRPQVKVSEVATEFGLGSSLASAHLHKLTKAGRIRKLDLGVYGPLGPSA
ncbi:DUF3631 domain-containing protein [Rhodococcus sp. CSLK01-03]|uniref:DUF3631 domain-containing protein n=1 Tax=Rhodococcus indonesiensis TaxID=3055869 RepID=A0ABT7RUS2_9NOCA|nr:DUF3631 domain-containing protein [Rhodococcus indonesiensis]MDM7490736.1 DUF3631 domain-containing protein [Rhodococcus indonesiensis]